MEQDVTVGDKVYAMTGMTKILGTVIDVQNGVVAIRSDNTGETVKVLSELIEKVVGDN